MESIQKIIDLVSEVQREGECPVRYGNHASSTLIQKAEEKLGGYFPEIYIEYVREYGVLSILGEEFYGLIDDEFEDSAIPDAVWITLKMRAESPLFDQHLIFHHDGSCAYHGIPLLSERSIVDNRCPVYRFEITHGGLKMDLEEKSFTEFTCNLINNSWEYW